MENFSQGSRKVLGWSAPNAIRLVDLAIAGNGLDWPAGSCRPWLTLKATGSTLGQRRYLPSCRTRVFSTSANFESKLAVRALMWWANSGTPRSSCICPLITYQGAPVARRRHFFPVAVCYSSLNKKLLDTKHDRKKVESSLCGKVKKRQGTCKEPAGNSRWEWTSGISTPRPLWGTGEWQKKLKSALRDEREYHEKYLQCTEKVEASHYSRNEGLQNQLQERTYT